MISPDEICWELDVAPTENQMALPFGLSVWKRTDRPTGNATGTGKQRCRRLKLEKMLSILEPPSPWEAKNEEWIITG